MKLTDDQRGLLKARRKDLGLTMEGVARTIGVTLSCIADIEKGRRGTRQSTLVEICRALSLDPATLSPIDKSAWDELTDMYCIPNQEPISDHDSLNRIFPWLEKYESELKQIPAKET